MKKNKFKCRFEFRKEFFHIPVHNKTINEIVNKETKELKWGNLFFRGECAIDDSTQKLKCNATNNFLSKKRSDKITIWDRFEKYSEKWFSPNNRYEHFTHKIQAIDSENSTIKEILLYIACEPIDIEERTNSSDLANGKRKFLYNYTNCTIENAEPIGNGWDDFEMDL